VTIAEDTEDPVALCFPTITLSITEGDTVVLSDIHFNNGSSDNCAPANYGLTQNTFTVDDEGSTTVTFFVFDEAGNESSCTTDVVVVNTTGMEELQLLNALSIYPNPSSGELRINLSGAKLHPDATLSVLDAQGKELLSTRATASTMQLDLSGHANGMYLIRLASDGTVAAKRVSVQR
jgi:hypothetical protein